jgi:tRNA (cmo5U34)-methyltransferase
MNNPADIGKGFSRLSSSYIFLSRIVFGKSLLRSQFYFTDQATDKTRILIAGIGTGELLIEILLTKSASEIVCVDISEGMIAKAKDLLSKKIPGNVIPVHFVCLPIQEYRSREKSDLIFFPYVLDCLQDKDLQVTLSNARQQLNTNGKIIVTDFQVPAKPLLARIYAKILIKILYLFFSLVCGLPVKRLPAFNGFLAEQGFKMGREHTFYMGILFTRMYSLQ